MIGLHDLWLFIGASVLLNLTPGVDMLYVMNQSARHGQRHGLVAALGISSGVLLHVSLAVVGLAALLAASATGFIVVKLLGAAYLMYLGMRMWFPGKPASASHAADATVHSLGKTWRQGILVCALNPKVALFFMAFLPQFVDANSVHHTWALLALGLIFTTTSTLVSTGIALMTAAIRRLFGTQRRIGAWLQRITGSLFIVLGLKLACGR